MNQPFMLLVAGSMLLAGWLPRVQAGGCPPGQQCAELGDCTSCVDCSPHTYSSEEGESACTACGTTYDQPLAGQSECVSCPSNSKSTLLMGCACEGDPATTRMDPSTGTHRECVVSDACDPDDYRDLVYWTCKKRLGTKENCDDETNYIEVPATSTTAGKCTNMCRLNTGRYLVQQEKYDRNHNIIEKRVCGLLSECDLDTEYTLYEPVKQLVEHFAGDTQPVEFPVTNRVCAPLTVCISGEEYTVPPTGLNADRTCVKMTQIISVSGTINGCRNRTLCQPGSGVSAWGGTEEDNACSLCDTGTEGSDTLYCTACDPGLSFTSEPGQPSCQTCTSCDNSSHARLCSRTQNSVCMDCPLSWHRSTSMCTPCAIGHYMRSKPTYVSNELRTDQNTDCVACPPNMYCVGSAHFEVCPAMVGFTVQGELVVVPSSPAGSSRASACSCTAAGGFSGAGGGLEGCSPCANGTYASPGDQRCTPCPVGHYASQERMHDDVGCAQSPPFQWTGPDGNEIAAPPAPECTVVVGAKQCSACPSGLTTRRLGASSSQECEQCGQGQYNTGDGTCANCTTACPEGTLLTGECNSQGDAQCEACYAVGGCGGVAGVYGGSCPGPNASTPLDRCARCTNLPHLNAHYTLVGAGGSCTW
jgi:hypothetical protein